MVIQTVQKLIREVLNINGRSAQFYNLKLKMIEQHWKHANIIHERLWTSATGEYDFDNYLRLESEINEGILEIQERSIEVDQGAATTDVNCRLPKIELPRFDGNYLEWRQFFDVFSEIVHNKPLPPCQKFLYLKSSLSGEAEGLLATTAANYDIAWQTLKERFENKRVIINTLLNKLVSQPISTQENVSTLKSLHDTTRECLHSLQNLNIPTSNWDPILVHLLVQRLSKTTHILWEQSLPDSREFPTLENFLNFIKLRFQSLEALGSKVNKSPPQGHNAARALVTVHGKGSCSICQGTHPLYACPTFIKWTPKERLMMVQKARRCVNCLKLGHRSKDCNSSTCTACNQKHNTLLHLETPAKAEAKKQAESKNSNKQTTITPTKALTAVKPHTVQPTQVLLSTVQLTIVDSAGNNVSCRALLDSGSQVNFITKQLVKKLGMPIRSKILDVEGIGKMKSRITERVNIEIASRCNGFSTRLEAYVLPTITSDQPTQQLCLDGWKLPANIPLSDENLHKPGRVDLLIGAGLFYSILCVGQISLGKGCPLLQNTLFGWVVGGGIDNKQTSNDTVHCGVGIQTNSLDDQLEKFWRIEECDAVNKNYTNNEMRCEKHFVSNIKRDKDGRFIVRLPIQGDLEQLGESKDIALQRFKSIEKKLAREPQLRDMYIKFMREYEKLNHMTEISPHSITGPHYFVPHHAVLKPESTTTKLRVVFDASAKTSKNYSLNDILATGPIIQPDVYLACSQQTWKKCIAKFGSILRIEIYNSFGGARSQQCL